MIKKLLHILNPFRQTPNMKFNSFAMDDATYAVAQYRKGHPDANFDDMTVVLAILNGDLPYSLEGIEKYFK